MTTISAAEANRHFSQVLRQVARGETLIVTSRGKPMATIAPITHQAGRSLAKHQLLARLTNQPPTGERSWARIELYEE
ncbi:MAG TPA: type II toxin-antitoxin system prevent-host-death family antitoxin [Xanthomonadaceae bacterium]|nr:type II toxin-antitoxin system prevent-host-death family antitoxin [Xanthomonadaceae bacterium]